MSRRPNEDSAAGEPPSLPEAAAARILARASELEASGEGKFALADLRAAAAEAGIPTHAFETALAEHLRATSVPTVRSPLWRRWTVAAAGAAAALLLALGVTFAFPRPAAAIVEEAIVLRCLVPGEAAELVRPLLRDRSTTVVHSMARAPRVLIVRGTADVIERAKALLAEHDGPASPACASIPVPPVAQAAP